MDEPLEEGDWQALTLTIDQVVRAGIRWLPAMTVLSFLPYFLLHGLPDVEWQDSVWGALWDALKWTLAAVAVYGISALLHELIHVIAMIGVAGARPSSIRFGFRPRDGVLYVHTDRPMSVRAYRIVLLLPAIVLGVLPLAYGTLAGVGWIVLYGYIMLVSAVGDFAVYQLILPLDAQAIVRDHPSGIGCLLRK